MGVEVTRRARCALSTIAHLREPRAFCSDHRLQAGPSRGGEPRPPPGRSGQPPALVLLIIASASSIVKVFGFWIGGKSLKVSANLSAIAYAP